MMRRVNSLLNRCRSEVLLACFRFNALGACGLILAANALFASYAALHKGVTQIASVKKALDARDANSAVSDVIVDFEKTGLLAGVDRRSSEHQKEMSDDLRILVMHASDQAFPLRVAADAEMALFQLHSNTKDDVTVDFRHYLAKSVEIARLNSRSYPVGKIKDLLLQVKKIFPDFEVESALNKILENSDHSFLEDMTPFRVDAFRMIPYSRKVLESTRQMERYLLENLPLDIQAKFKDQKNYKKYLERLPHAQRKRWSAFWRWMANLFVTQKANDYSGENHLGTLLNPVHGVLNLFYTGPISNVLKLSIDHLSSRIFQRFVDKPWRPGVVTHLATSYLVGTGLWIALVLEPFVLAPLRERAVEEVATEDAVEKTLMGNPEVEAYLEEIAMRITYDQRFHRYFIDHQLNCADQEAECIKAAKTYLRELKDFYERWEKGEFENTQLILEHPVFYKEKDFVEHGFNFKSEEEQYLRQFRFDTRGEAYRYLSPKPIGNRMALGSHQVDELIAKKIDYLMITEAIYQATEYKEKNSVSWKQAISESIKRLPTLIREKAIAYWDASSGTVVGKALDEILKLGSANEMSVDPLPSYYLVDRQIQLMLQAITNADLEWKTNQIIGRQMNRRKKVTDTESVYDIDAPPVSEEEYIGSMPRDMFYVIRQLDEESEKSSAFEAVFKNLMENN